MNRQFERYLQMTLVIIDLVALSTVYFFCEFIFTEKVEIPFANSYILYWVVSNASWLILTFFLRNYSERTILNFESFTKRTIQVYFFWIIAVMFYLFFSRELEVSRLFIVSTIGGFGVGLMANRFIYLGLNKYFRNNDFYQKKILILGFNDTAKKLARYFEDEGINIRIMGFIENYDNVTELSNYPVLGNMENALEVAKEMEIQEIFSTISPEQNKDIYRLMHQSENECIRFRVVPNLSVFFSREVHIEYFGELPILSLRSEPLDDVGNRIKKRSLDVVVSLFTIIFFLSWLIPILGLLIFLESGRPIFFRQLRTGRDKKPFLCLKLRTMKKNKEADLKQATKDDNRITAIGRFLRRTSLDEIPQFFNVLKGEMSLVGPRPHMVKHTSDYSHVVDDYMVRQFVKPGITGWAQINGYRGEITNAEQIKMRVKKDIWYLENWTLWLDVRILFLTIYYVFKGDDHAY